MYTYLTARDAQERLNGIQKALTAAKLEYARMDSMPDVPHVRVKREGQKAKIARLTQRRVTMEKHLDRARGYEAHMEAVTYD